MIGSQQNLAVPFPDMDSHHSLNCFLSLRVLQALVHGTMIDLGLHIRKEFWSQSAAVPNNVWFTIIFTSFALIYSVTTAPFVYYLTLRFLYSTVILDILFAAAGSLVMAIQMSSRFSILLCRNGTNQNIATQSCTW